MDAALPAPLGAPQAEVLEDVLHEQFGPLPQLAAICRLKRRPSGGYSSTEDLQLVLERRRVANAKERERVSGPRLPGPQVPSNLLRPPVPAPRALPWRLREAASAPSGPPRRRGGYQGS